MKYASKFFCMFGLFLSAVSLGSAQDKQSNTYFDQTREVNSKIWSQSYWRAMAEKGLVEVAKEVEVPKGRYTSDVIVSPLVLNPASTDIPVSNLTNITQSENSIFVNPQDINNVLNSNNSTNWPVTLLYGTSGFYSTDGGQSWGGSPQGTGGSNYGDPAAVINLSGTFYVGFITSMGGQGIAYSTNQGATWTARQVAFENGSFMDKNHLWVDNSPTSPYAGYLYAAWTDFDGNNNSNIELSRSTDGGLTWSTPINVSSASGGLFHQGVNIQTGPNGEVYVVWTIYENWPQDEGAIGFAKSTNGGASFQPATRVISNIRGIRNTGTSKNMRVNSFPSSAVDISNGPNRGNIYVVWSNTGTPGENVGTDIDGYLVRSTDGGVSWSTPVKINQDPSGLGKQHYFQWITCDPVTGILAVVFYDDRNVSSTMCETFVAISADAGSTWTDFKVSDVAFTPSPIPGLADGYFGDYLGISARSGRVYPIWTDNRDGRAMAYVSPFVLEKDSIPPAAVDDLAAIEPASNSITLTWTATGDDGDSGTASRYDIRYSLSPIDELNFDSATQVDGEPVPQTAGSLETFTVHGLDFNTTYYFAIKAFDEWSNGSDVSNSPSATTLGIPDIAVSPESLSADLLTGGTDTLTLTITNVAEGTLDFSFPDYAARALLSKPGIQKNDVSNDFEPVTLKKGEKDSREGHPIILGAGGPDNFGYRWIDSDEPGGPTFNWVDISGVGSPVYLGDDDFIEVNLPFSFPFYGVDKTNVKISSNGYLTFGSDAMSYTNEPIPSSALPNDFIAAFWDDLYPPSGGTIYYYYDEAGNRFIVEYFNINHIGSIGTYTFEIILYPDGQILLQYLDVTGEVNASTTGIENADGMDGLQVAFNTDYVHDGLAVSIAAVPNWLSVNPAFGRVLAGQSMDIDVTFDATGMNGGDYYKDLTIASNDPDESVVSVPAHLHVTGAPDIAVLPESLEYGTVFIGGSKTLTVKVSNPGTDVLNVTNITSSHGDYTVDSVSFSIAPRASRMVAVTLTPTTEGEISGTVTFESNDPDEPTVVVSVHGVGALPPDIAVTPDSLSEDLFTGETATQTMTISNSGVSDLVFDIKIENITAQKMQKAFRVPPSNGEFPRGTDKASVGVAPKQTAGAKARQSKNGEILSVSTIAYGSAFDLSSYGEYYASFDVATPEVVMYDNLTNSFMPAGDFGGQDMSYYYAIDGNNYQLVKIDTATSGKTIVGNIWTTYGESWTGMADDPTSGVMYASGTNIYQSYLYTVNVETGAATLVGEITNAPGIIAIACDGMGNLYGLDIVNDNLLSIDKTTGAGTIIGSIGYDANYSQGMEYDVANGILYIAAYNNATYQGELRIADPATGNTTLVGVLGSSVPGGYGAEVSFMGIPGGVQWLSAEPKSGTVPSGQSVNVTMTFDAAGLFGGDYYANINVNSNDPDESVVSVPAHLHVTGAPDIAVDTDSLEYGTVFIGSSKTLTVKVSNPGTDVLNVTNITSSHGDYTVDSVSFSIAPRASRMVAVTLTPTTEGEISGTVTFESNDPDEPTVVVSVHGVGALPPDIAVTPDSLSEDLFTGETATQTMTISNSGVSDLVFDIKIENITVQKMQKAFRIPPSNGEFPRGTDKASVGVAPKQTAGAKARQSKNGEILSVSTIAYGSAFDLSSYGEYYASFDVATPEVVMYDNLTNSFMPAGDFGGQDMSYYYAIDGNNYQLVKIDTATSGKTIVGNIWTTYGESWTGMADDPTSGVMYASGTNIYQSYLYTVNVETGAATLVGEITNAPGIIAIACDGMGNLYGLDIVNDNLLSIDKTTGAGTIIGSIGYDANYSQGMEYDVANGILYIAAYNNATYQGELRIADPATGNTTLVGVLGSSVPGGYGAEVSFMGIPGGVQWLSAEPKSGTVPSGQSVNVTMTFDAAGLFGGDYYANINVNSNDPDESVVSVPAHLHVTGAPDIAVDTDSLEYGTVFIGSSKTLTVKVSNPGTDVLNVTNITSSHGDYTVDSVSFSIAPRASRMVAVTLTPTTKGEISGTVTLESNDPDEPTVVVSVHGVGALPPDIAVTPDSLSEDLFTGETATQTITINNTGVSDLTFDIDVQNITAQGSFLKQTYIVNFEPEAYITKSTVLGKKQTIDGLGIHEMPKPFTVKKQVSSSGLHILLAMADDGASYITSQLLSYPDIASVSIFNTRFGTPTLDDLKNYDAVLTWSNYYPYDPVALGNVLADYVDQGGGVVIATFSFGYGALSGRIMDTSYSPLISAFRGNHYNAASMEILKPDHFIMTGVTNASDFYRDYTVLTEGSELVARWNDGENYVAAKGNIVGVNSYVGDYYSYTGDVPRIVYNCLLYVSGKGRWLSANPESGVVPAGQSLEITMTFDAAGLNGGDYYANIQVNSNDPDEPTVTVPAHLHVTGAPDIAFAPMSLEYRTVFIGGSATQTVIVSNPGTDVLNVTNVMSSHSDYTTNLTSFNLNPGQQQVVQVTFTPTTEGEIAGTLTFESNDPDEPTVVVSVHGVGVLPPDIAVTPDSLFADLFAGSTETQTLTISNTGNSDLLWQATTAFAERTAVVRTSPVFASSTRASQEKKLGSVPPAKPSEDEIYRMTAENITVASKPVKTLQGSPIGLLPQQASLESILESLNENYTSVNSQIPNRYDFSEGESGYYISDGGDDMYDNGNFLGTNVGSYLYYSDNVITPSGYLGEGGRYFTRKYPGLFVFVADVNNVNYFEITGDLGADGSGNADGAVLEIQLHGVVYRGFVKRVYNTYDPSVNHLIIVADNPDAAHEFSTYTNDDYHRVYNITASRRIYYLLYAGTTGYYIDNSATFAIMNAFLNSLNLTPNWLTVNPTSGTVPAGSSMDVDVTFDAGGLNRGDYYASVNINSNDPDEPVVGMPAHLRVTGVLSGGFSVAINIQNNDAERMLIFGSHTDATYCIDYALQEIELPPIPPTEVYDVRFIDPHGASECMGQGLQTNYHKWEMTPVTDTFQIRLQAGVGGYPIVLTWPSGLSAYYSSLSLQDIICGCVINVDMLTNTTFSITNTAIDKLNIVGVPLPNVGGPPSIAVTPTALNAMLNSGDTTTQSLLISNNGGSDLVFTIVIDSVVATKVSINTGIEQRGSGTPEKKLLKSNYSNGNVVEKGVVSFNVRRLGGLDWLSADPVSDTLHVGESMEVTMTFNATNLDSGDFNANVLVNSNDPSVPIVTIPAHLRVNEAMNLPPSAFHLISPKNLDTLKLDINCPPIMFSWHESLDPEGEDVFYSIRILGPNLDTTTVGLQDTSVELGIRCKLQPSTPYVWSVSATDGVNIVAALDTFIFVASDSVNAADDVGRKIPERYTLLQNYPNPFNPATTFKYSLPTRSWVKLEIYNVLGQHIITLVDQTQETGYYEKTWNANVSSGMYFYRLEAVDVSNPSNTFIELKRMILLK